MEEWKCVIGGYEVSTLGRVRNIENNSKILRPNLDSAGYLKLDLYDITIRIHRLVAEAFIPNPYQLPFVNHKDGIKFYNWVDNLEWVTERDNNLHPLFLSVITGCWTTPRLATQRWIGEPETTCRLLAIDRGSFIGLQRATKEARTDTIC